MGTFGFDKSNGWSLSELLFRLIPLLAELLTVGTNASFMFCGGGRDNDGSIAGSQSRARDAPSSFGNGGKGAGVVEP